jgi:hypothetical protein
MEKARQLAGFFVSDYTIHIKCLLKRINIKIISKILS